FSPDLSTAAVALTSLRRRTKRISLAPTKVSSNDDRRTAALSASPGLPLADHDGPIDSAQGHGPLFGVRHAFAGALAARARLRTRSLCGRRTVERIVPRPVVP